VGSRVMMCWEPDHSVLIKPTLDAPVAADG
jgi:hypothetical protein